MDEDKKQKSTTTDGKPPCPGHELSGAPAPIDPITGQHKAYWVLTEEERKKGFIRPVRRKYMHNLCGTVTEMSTAIAETYARDPGYYGSTFCVHCRNHFPVNEFVWDGTAEVVGS